MTFFDPSEWDGKLYSSGWVAGGAGSKPIFEPATQGSIGNYGNASPEDVTRAAHAAVTAQKSWAAASYEERAGVLRRAGTLIEENADVLSDWLVREAGSAKGKAGFEAHLVSGVFYAASAIAMAPYGQLLRSGKPRLSLARRLPVGVVGVISPFNFPQILSIRSVAPALALGNAVILKPDPRTAVSGGLVLAAHLRGGGPAGGPASTCCPAAPTSARRWSTEPAGAGDLLHRVDQRRPGGRRARRASTSSACTWSSAATTPCSCWTTSTCRPRSRRAPGARSSTRVRSA